MRILTLANCPLEISSGSGYVVLGYAEGLRNLGHCVELVGAASFELLPEIRRAIHYKQALGMAIAALRHLRKGHFDLIEFYGSECWLAATLLRRRAERPFLVAHSNGLETHAIDRISACTGDGRSSLKNRAQRRLSEIGFRRVDALVTVSHYDARFAARESYVPPSRLLPIENPLPDEYLGQSLALDRPQTIGFVGNWTARKGIGLIMEDLPRVLADHPDWTAHLVGVGSPGPVLACFPTHLHGRVRVTPKVERSALRDLYGLLSIVIVPSLYESFGLVTAEAMACGCCVVAAPTGFAADLVSGEEVLLLRDCESASLHSALNAVIADASLRRSIAIAGHRRAQLLQWRPAISRLSHAYESWVSQNSQRGKRA